MRELPTIYQSSTKGKAMSTHTLNKTSKLSKEWLSPHEAAQYSGLGLSTLAKLRITGAGCAYSKIGAKVVYCKSNLDAWLASKHCTSTSQEIA
jgi:hypothetical protein